MKKSIKLLASLAMIFALVFTSISPIHASAGPLSNKAETFFNLKKMYEFSSKGYHGIKVEGKGADSNGVRVALHLDTIKSYYQSSKLKPETNIMDLLIEPVLESYDTLKSMSNDGYVYIEQTATPNKSSNTAQLKTDFYAGKTLFGSFTDEADLNRYKLSPNVSFTDIKANHWATMYIYNLARMGIVNGANGKYMPDDNITRAQFSAMLSRTIPNAVAISEGTNFTDVKGHWAQADIMKLYELGIVGGYSEQKFGPNDKITRQQAVAMMARYLDALGYDTSKVSKTLKFDDQNQIQPYAREAVAILSNLGVISGTGNNKFNPTGQLTRAQMAKILDGVLQLNVK